jgi:hypothetical protein
MLSMSLSMRARASKARMKTEAGLGRVPTYLSSQPSAPLRPFTRIPS